MSRVLEDQVIREAIRWFEEDESRYTPDAYLRGENRHQDVAPGRDVVQACAIGGVEQSLWRVTGRVVDEDRERPQFAYAGSLATPQVEKPEGDLGVYWGVMHRLNLETRRRAVAGLYDEFYEEDYELGGFDSAHAMALLEVLDVEDVTQIGNEERSREMMLDVFRAALVAPVETPDMVEVLV